MNNTYQSNNCNAKWRFIEDNLPNYYHRDDVLRDNILYSFLEGEEVCDDDLEWIEEEFHSDKKMIAEELRRMEAGFLSEALESADGNLVL